MSWQPYVFAGPATESPVFVHDWLTKEVRSDARAGYLRYNFLVLNSYLTDPGSVIFSRQHPVTREDHQATVRRGLSTGRVALFALATSHDGTPSGRLVNDGTALVQRELLATRLRILRRRYKLADVMLDLNSSEYPYAPADETLDEYLARSEKAKYGVFAVIRPRLTCPPIRYYL